MYRKKDARSIIQEKAKGAIDKLDQDLSSGVLGTQSAYLSALQTAWNTVFSSIQEGTTVEVPSYRKGELPMLEDLQSPLLSASYDITSLWEQMSDMRYSLLNDFNTEVALRDDISYLIGEVQNKVSNFQLFASDNEELFLWSSDSFTSFQKVDKSRTTAHVDTGAGRASLSTKSWESLNTHISSVTIDSNSGAFEGIPGNNMVISDIGGSTDPNSADPEPTVTLEGSTDLHSIIGYAFDSSPTTWWEWESVYIPRNQKCKMVGNSYVTDSAGKTIDILRATEPGEQPTTSNAIPTAFPGWKKFIQWPGREDYDTGKDGNGYWIAETEKEKTARVTLHLALDGTTILSNIAITPKAVNGCIPIVRSIKIGNTEATEGYTKEIAKDAYLTSKLNEGLDPTKTGIPEGNYTGIGVWSAGQEPVTDVWITLEGYNRYTPPAWFGHQYYYQVIHKHSSTSVLGFTVSSSNKTYTNREINPQSGVSAGSSKGDLSKVGMAAGAVIGSFLPGIGTVAGWLTGGLIGSIAGGLIGSSSETDIVRSGNSYDIFDGTRSVIGIQDIDLSIKSYNTSSVVVSTPHYFTKPLDAVSIISTEVVPDGWDTNTEWIQYEVSTDGQIWTKITPESRADATNISVPVNGSTSISVRITLSSPSSSSTETPYVLAYCVKGLPKE
jgi:hypothetical protein